MKIKFIKVGRGKKTWTGTVTSFSQQQMEDQIRKKGALMSRDISFSDADGDDEGEIYAGLRCVGRYRIIED